MALSLENQNYVWQRVREKQSIMHPDFANQLYALRKALAESKRGIKLQLIPFTEAQAITNGGTDLVGEACTLYALYVKKTGAGTPTATDSFAAVHAAATNGSSATVVALAALLVANEERLVVDPVGIPVATGATISEATAPGGATESTAQDGGPGFIIVGAA